MAAREKRRGKRKGKHIKAPDDTPKDSEQTNLTDPDATAVEYTLADYERMAALGFNYQSIRVDAAALGAWPGVPEQPGYLERLDDMVALAKQAGMYSNFKLTFYNLDALGYTEGDASAAMVEARSGGS